MILTLPDYLRGWGRFDYAQPEYRPVPHAMPGTPAQYGVEEPPVMAQVLAKDMFRFYYRARRVTVQANYSISGDGYEETGQGTFVARRNNLGYFYPEEGETPKVRDTTAVFGGFAGDVVGDPVQIRGEIARRVTLDGEDASDGNPAVISLSGFFVAEEALNDVAFYFQDGRYALPFLRFNVGGGAISCTGTLFGNRFETPPGFAQEGYTYTATATIDFESRDETNDLPF